MNMMGSMRVLALLAAVRIGAADLDPEGVRAPTALRGSSPSVASSSAWDFNTPTDVANAFRRALDPHKPCPKIAPKSVNPLLIGATRPVDGELLDARPHEYLRWWLTYEHLAEGVHNCCNISALECACNLIHDVGINESGMDMTDFGYMVAVGNFSNTSAKKQGSGPVSVLSPTWRNLALHINGTFNQTFGQASTDASWESKCPSGGVSEEVILQLEKFTNGCRPGPGNFLSFSTEYPAVDGYVKCSGACGSCGKRLGVCTDPAEFLESVKGHSLCTDVATVRAYMFCFLDANSFFLGTGYDAGASGPESPEWVTLPNLPYKEAGDISIYRFGASGTCQTRLG